MEKESIKKLEDVCKQLARQYYEKECNINFDYILEEATRMIVNTHSSIGNKYILIDVEAPLMPGKRLTFQFEYSVDENILKGNIIEHKVVSTVSIDNII